MNETKVSDQLKENYDDYYSSGDSEWRRIGAECKADNIVELCGSLPKSKVLEVGAGEGSILKRLDELSFGESLYALEISQSGVDAISSKGIRNLADCKLFNGYQVPYEDKTFDIAIMSHVVEHVEHERALLYEVSRVARYVYVEVPLEDTLRLSHEFVLDKVGHINFYSPKTLRRLVQSCNLNVINQITRNPSKATHTFYGGRKGLVQYYIKEGFLRAMPLVAPKFFTYHGALVCENKEG